MVRQLSDPDNMGATPTHQADMQEVNADIWGPKDGHPGEIPLLVPFLEPKRITNSAAKGMLNVEGQAIRKSHRQASHKDGSAGSTAPASTPATHRPWSHTTSHINEEDLYPAEHLFICTLKDSDNPDKTPYAATTTGFPLYKGSYQLKHNKVPRVFQPNLGDHFISFPIKSPHGDIQQAEYVQVILHPNPIVIGLRNDSDKVYTKPLYAEPVFHYDGKPIYQAEQLEKLKIGAEGQEQMDWMIRRLNDPSLTAKVHQFRAIAQELEQLEEAISESKDWWGELASMHCKTIQRLEMADALLRIQDQDEGLVDDVLRSSKESEQRGHRT